MTEPRVDPSDETHEQLLRAAAFLRRVLRFWGTALTILVVGAVAGGGFLFVRHPKFRSETVILYSETVRMGDEADRPGSAHTAMVRLKEILMSRTSLDAIVREFNLYPEIRKTLGPVDAVEELKKHIEFRAPGGDTFSLAFTGASPAEAQAVTTRLAAVILSEDSELRSKQASLLREFLETEKRTTEDGLRDAELALASFMAAHPRFALDTTPLATGAAIRASLGAGGSQPSAPGAARPRAYPYGAATRRVPAAGTEGPSAQVAAPAPVEAREAAAEEARAKAALAAARANLMDLAARFTPAHPDVRAAQAEVERETNRLAAATAAVAAAELSPSIAGAGAPPAAALPVPLPALSPPVSTSYPRPAGGAAGGAAAAGSAGAPPASEHDVVALETEWVRLTRLATEAREHEDQVEAALFKANSAAKSESGDHGVRATVIDPAFLPQSAVPPGRTTIAMAFAGVSLLLAALGAAFKALLDDRVYEERDIGQLAPFLASVPRRAHV